MFADDDYNGIKVTNEQDFYMISDSINWIWWLNRTNWEVSFDTNVALESKCHAPNVFHLILDRHITNRFMKWYEYACKADENLNLVWSTTGEYYVKEGEDKYQFNFEENKNYGFIQLYSGYISWGHYGMRFKVTEKDLPSNSNGY